MSKATDKKWTTYLLKCADGTFYCGITNKSPAERIKVHNTGKGSKYTRGRLPVALHARRKNLTHSQALKLERIVKRQRRNKKVAALQNEKSNCF